MICSSCVDKLIETLAGEAGCPITGFGYVCSNPGKCEFEKLLMGIHKYTEPDTTARNAYSFLQDIAKLSGKCSSSTSKTSSPKLKKKPSNSKSSLLKNPLANKVKTKTKQIPWEE